jgi:hypothetical protein
MTAKLQAVLGVANDALDQLGACHEALRQLESVLWTLKTTLGESHTGRLAGVGAYLALDRGDAVEADLRQWREQLDVLEVSE